LIHQPIIKRSSPYFALYQAARVKIVAIVTQMRQGLSVLCRIRRRDERLAVVRRTSESFDRPSLLGHSSQPRGFGCILSVVGGVAFIGLALFLTLRHPEQTSIGTSSTNPSAQPPTPQRETFPEPMYGGFGLDACYESHTRCGEEPTTAWCKRDSDGRSSAQRKTSALVGFIRNRSGSDLSAVFLSALRSSTSHVNRRMHFIQ
jgi:hypothetical protein